MIEALMGDTIFSISADYMLRLFTAGGWQIDLEGEVDVHHHDGASTTLIKNGPGTVLPPELDALPGQAIEALQREASGDLVITFADLTLTTRVDPDYESWQIYGPLGQILVCGPGGRMTEWGPRFTDRDGDASQGAS